MNAVQVASNPHQTLLRLVFGSTGTQVVGAVVRLGLADAIGEGQTAVDGIARHYDIPAERMNRLLRAMVELDLATEPRPGVYSLTEAGHLLRVNHPGSLRHMARLVTDPVTQLPWSRLDSSVRTGRAAFEDVFGRPMFEHFAAHPDLSALYNAAMGEITRGLAVELAECFDFSRFTRVTDVGGGDGTLLTTVLGRHPHLTGVVFDSPSGVAQTLGAVRAAGLDRRCTVTTGDFFEAVPTGSDLYLLKSIVHDWDDERAVTVLRRCGEALGEGGRVLLVEQVLPERPESTEPRDPFLSDLTMLVLYGGRERTRADLVELCTRAGLKITSTATLPAQPGISLMEATAT
ncbi:methyltransferase [Parafrankia sp. FMc2]